MFVNHASASCINTYRWCPFQYFLRYELQMEAAAGKAAVLGKIAHEVFEKLALARKAGEAVPEPMDLLDAAWDRHTAENPDVGLRRETSRGEAADFRKVRTFVETILSDPHYNPSKLKVISAEDRFELEMPGEEWQVTRRDGTTGQFVINGYMDLVHEINPAMAEIVDWKTGRRADFATGKPKDFDAMRRDVQVRLYHLAALHLLPHPTVMITFHWLADGGPVTVPLTFEDAIATTAAVWRWFQRVKYDTVIPRSRTWRCKRICPFGRTGICDQVWSDLNTMGREYVQCRYQGMNLEKQKQKADCAV